MEKTVVMNPDDLMFAEKYLYEAGKQAQREAEARIIKDQYGQEYIIAGGELLQIAKEPHEHIMDPDTIKLSTLKGLVQYIEEDPDHIFHVQGTKYQIIVESPSKVSVVSPATGFYKERLRYVTCEADVPNISLGRYMETENFQVMLQTCFVQTENLDLVMKLAGSVRKEQSLQTADDGVSQKVTINSGVNTASDVIVKNPVTLIPFRTFVEIEQPESPFVLRFDKDGNAALFTGSGKAWEVEAKMAIANFLEDSLNLCSANVCVLL